MKKEYIENVVNSKYSNLIKPFSDLKYMEESLKKIRDENGHISDQALAVFALVKSQEFSRELLVESLFELMADEKSDEKA